MGTQNSLVGVVTDLLIHLFEDLKRFYPEIRVDLERDEATALSRLSSEGLGFVTKTLPKFGKSFDLALQGLMPLTALSFGKGHRSALPKFLRGLLGMVFDKTTAMVLTAPNVAAISDIRQLCFMFYKLEMPYDPAKLASFTADFVAVDTSLPDSSDHLDSSGFRIMETARGIIAELFKGIDPFNVTPRCGPGEVATGEKPWQKYHFARRYADLDEFYPFEDYFLTSYSQFVDEAEDNILPLEDVSPGEAFSRLAFVPKDSRGPRLIAMEPLEYMWIQQGIKSLLYDWIESHPLTKGHVNFSNQEINRELARQSSIDGELVTLDMKEASDRVSLWLVKELFAQTSLLPALLATRTPSVELPTGVRHTYRKFAPMGSALCFPIEAVCFWALSLATVHTMHQVPLLLAKKLVWVYGDDIIIHKDFFESLFNVFPQFGLQFNKGKCCTHGHFRESCGMDAYLGESITPTRIKKLPPVNRDDVNALVAYVNQGNNLWKRGYYNLANALCLLAERLVGQLPSVTAENISFLAKYSRVGVDDPRPRRWNKDLQRFRYKSWVVHSPCQITDKDDWCEVLRFMLPHDENLRGGVYPKRYKIYLQRKWV